MRLLHRVKTIEKKVFDQKKGWKGVKMILGYKANDMDLVRIKDLGFEGPAAAAEKLMREIEETSEEFWVFVFSSVPRADFDSAERWAD